MIERFYDEWYTSWAPALASAPAPAMAPMESLPPYVDILVTHTRLSTYAGVINHPTAALEVKRFFRAAALSSALNVLRAAIQGESRLKSMPNNTVIMISFAACSALTLGVTPADSRSSLAPSVRNLIDETAGVLERIGATPSHRNGSSALYGKFLRELIRRQAGAGAGVAAPYQLDADADADADAVRVLPGPLDACDMDVHAQQPLSPVFLSEPLHFSAMSDNQIVDAINQAGSAFGTTVPDVPLEDMLQWDWTT